MTVKKGVLKPLYGLYCQYYVLEKEGEEDKIYTQEKVIPIYNGKELTGYYLIED